MPPLLFCFSMMVHKPTLHGASLTLNRAEFLSSPIRQKNALALLAPRDASCLALKGAKGMIDERLFSTFGMSPRRHFIRGFQIIDVSGDMDQRKLCQPLIKEGIQRSA